MVFERDSIQSFQKKKKTEKCGDIISKEYFDCELQLCLRCNTPQTHTSAWLPITRNPEEKCGYPQHDGHRHHAPSQNDTQPHGVTVPVICKFPTALLLLPLRFL